MNHEFLETGNFVSAFGPQTIATGQTIQPQRVSMKGYDSATVIVSIQKSTSASKSTITLNQTTSVGNSPDVDKPISFDHAYRILNAGGQSSANGVWEKISVSNDAITTANTASQRDVYAIPVSMNDLDVANGFDVIFAGMTAANNNVASVAVLLHDAHFSMFPPFNPLVD